MVKHFYPGYYFGKFTSADPARKFWDANLKGREYNAHTGLIIQLRWRDLYKAQPKDPEDPSDPAYDWSELDRCMDLPARIYLVLRHRPNSTPTWAPHCSMMVTMKHGERGVFAVHRAAAVRVWEQFCVAFGKRYRGTDKLAGIQLQEHVRIGQEPPDWNKPQGGGSGGLTGQDAWFHGLVATVRSMREAVPDVCIFQASVTSRTPEIVEMGAGLHYPDPRFFFGTCGTKDGGTDCNPNDYYGLAQRSKDLVPLCAGCEPNGWRMAPFPTGDNPWGIPKGRKMDPITLEMWYWYFGADGIVPSHYFKCSLGMTQKFTFEQHEAAIKKFGKPYWLKPGPEPEEEIMFDVYITGGNRINVLPQEFSAKMPKPYADLSPAEYDFWVRDISVAMAAKFRLRLAALRPGGGHAPTA
jgi:hypothetical protein